MSGQAGGNAQDAAGDGRLWSGQESRPGDLAFGDCLLRRDREGEGMGLSDGTAGEQLEPALGPIRGQEDEE